MENNPPPNSPPGNSSSSGSNLLDLPKGLNPQSLQKRPSIAPVPAFIEGNAIDIQVRSVNIFRGESPYSSFWGVSNSGMSKIRISCKKTCWVAKQQESMFII